MLGSPFINFRICDTYKVMSVDETFKVEVIGDLVKMEDPFM